VSVDAALTLEELRGVLSHELAREPKFGCKYVDEILNEQGDMYHDFVLVHTCKVGEYADSDTNSWSIFVTGTDKQLFRHNPHGYLNIVKGLAGIRYS